MLKHFKLTITTKAGKRYSMDWSCQHSAIGKTEHVSDILIQHSHFIVNEKDDECVVIPRTAVDTIKLREVYNKRDDDY